MLPQSQLQPAAIPPSPTGLCFWEDFSFLLSFSGVTKILIKSYNGA